jgi:hypothetical protein
MHKLCSFSIQAKVLKKLRSKNAKRIRDCDGALNGHGFTISPYNED